MPQDLKVKVLDALIVLFIAGFLGWLAWRIIAAAIYQAHHLWP
jgi:hypothetical protein